MEEILLKKRNGNEFAFKLPIGMGYGNKLPKNGYFEILSQKQLLKKE